MEKKAIVSSGIENLRRILIFESWVKDGHVKGIGISVGDPPG